MKIIRLLLIALLTLSVIAAAAVLAGQLGLFKGTAPQNLGVRDGRLLPAAVTPNSVVSQADLPGAAKPGYNASIAPLRFTGDAAAALQRLAALLATTPGVVVKVNQPEASYLYAQATTRLMKYTDDVEFYADAKAGVIHVRSASRLGESDMGANRTRIEDLRARFEASPTAAKP